MCSWTTRSCTDTENKDAKVTFLTMIDTTSGAMVATAVQKKGHDKFVERYLLKGLESFGVTSEMVLQTGQGGRDRSMLQNMWLQKEKRRPSSDKLPRKAVNQTHTWSEHIKLSKAWSEP